MLDFQKALQAYQQQHGMAFLRGEQGLSVSNSSNLMIEFHSSESETQSYICQLDDEVPHPCNAQSPLGQGIASTGYISEGQFGLAYFEGLTGSTGNMIDVNTHEHQLRVSAVDEALNVGDPLLFEWTIDQMPAFVKIATNVLFDGGSRRSNDLAAVFEFSSTSGGVLYECRL